MNRNSFRYLFFFLLYTGFYCFSQQKSASISLKLLLEEISITHNVKFSYIEEEIKDIIVENIDNNLPLKDKVSLLEKKTKLHFDKISEKYYSIFDDGTSKKSILFHLTNAETGEPVENALIIIENNSKNIFSDSNGRFLVPKAKKDKLHIHHQGYEEKIIDLKSFTKTNSIQIELIPKIKVLDEVIAQRFLTSGIYKSKGGTIQIKPLKFGILPGLIEPDVLQTMQQIPGIISVDESVANINIRGGTHDQNLFIWNDIRMFQTGHFFGMISAFNPATAKTMNITKNGTSAFFGESVSGLIEMNSTDKESEKSNASINSNLISSDVYSHVKLDKNSSISISYRRSLTDFFESPTYKNYTKKIFQNTIITNLDNNQVIDYKNDVNFYFYDASMQFSQKIGKKNKLNVSLIGIENKLNINQFTSTQSKKSKLEQENFGASISLLTHWNETNQTEFSGFISNYDLNSRNESIENTEILNQKNEVLETNFKIRHTKSFEKNKLSLGYQLDETGVKNVDEVNEPLFFRSVKDVLISHSLIAENEFNSSNDKVFVVTGLRANYFQELNKIIIEPRIQFNYKLNEKLKFEVLGEMKNQTISQIIDLQKDFLGVEKRRWVLANDTIIPIQKSIQASIGLNYKTKKWLINFENFYKRISGITTNSQGFQNQFEFIKSIGNYTVLGSELLVQKSFKKFYTWISYSINNNTYDYPELSPKEFPNNFDITHTINWAGIYEWKNFKIALGTNWHTGRPYTTPVSNTVSSSNSTITYNSPNNKRLKDFFQSNISASKKWKLNDKIELETALSVINIFNIKNITNRYYKVDTSNNTIQSIDTYSLETTPNFKLKLNFK